MRKQYLVGPDCLVAGIDIAKETHWVQFMEPFGNKVGKAFSFNTSREGFESLLKRANQLMEQTGLKRVVFGMEPTGHYWKTLAQYLLQTGTRFVLVNPYHVKQSKEWGDNSPSKNDRKDACTIAKLVRDNHYLVPVIRTGIYAELEQYAKNRRMLSKKIKSVICQIKACIDEFFPELPGLFKTLEANSTRWLLKTVPFPEQILKCTKEELVNGLKLASNKRQGDKRAGQLIELAASSIGLRGGSNAAHQRIRLLVSEYECYLSQIKSTEEMLEGLIGQTGLGEYLISIPGVGITSAALFLAEIGDPGQYGNWREIQKLAGLNIRENSSGKHKGERRITKRGRASLRSLAYQLALMAVVHNRELKMFYEHLLQRPKRALCKMQALIAVSVRVLRIMFTLAKKKMTYNPEIARYSDCQAA